MKRLTMSNWLTRAKRRENGVDHTQRVIVAQYLRVSEAVENHRGILLHMERMTPDIKKFGSRDERHRHADRIGDLTVWLNDLKEMQAWLKHNLYISLL